MTNETRAALVDKLAEKIDTNYRQFGLADEWASREEAESYVAEIEKALRAAGDVSGLDDVLDSVHPDAAVHVWLESEPEPDVGLPHYFMARLDVNGPDTSDPHYGTGPTRRAAILDAVAKAQKEANRG